MEQNLPFVSLPIADKGYNKLVIPFLGKLDDGNVFKNIITSLLSILAITFLVGGIYLSIAGLFGDDGFIETYIANDGFETLSLIDKNYDLNIKEKLLGMPFTGWVEDKFFKGFYFAPVRPSV